MEEETQIVNDLILNDKKSFQLIYCFSCKSFPEIEIKNKGKELLFSKICKCQPQLEKSINELNMILFNNREKKKICQKDNDHGIAVEFCTMCLKWYCSKCSIEHKSIEPNHITIKLNEKIEINTLCENENCSDKGKIEFYCKNCLKNLCLKCKMEHDKKHEIIIYEDFFKKENIIKFKRDVKEVSDFIKEKNSEYSKIIGDIENIIKNLKNLLEIQKQRYHYLLKLYESMIDTYALTYKINNYQIRKNILNAYSVKDIFKKEENYNRDILLIEIENLNKKIIELKDVKTPNEKKIDFLNLLHCPLCKDYIKIESIETKNLEFKIKFNCPKNLHKFENKILSEFINENKQNNIFTNYICENHNECYKYFCLKCNVNFCEKCKEHEEHKENIYDLSKEIALISDINNKKLNNKKELENIEALQIEFKQWIKEFDLKMVNYFESIKFILHCKDEIFNNIDNKKYNYFYVLNCNYIINKLQIEKKFEPKYLPKNLPHFIKYGYDVLKFIGFNAEGRPKYLCSTCYEKLGKPETYSYWSPPWCHCGHNVGAGHHYCFICAKHFGNCFSCGGNKGGSISGVYCLKN